jgi:hypothetical protein
MIEQKTISPEITWTEGSTLYGAYSESDTFTLVRLETMRYQVSGKVIAKSWIAIEWHFLTESACRHHAYTLELSKTKVEGKPPDYKAFQVVGHPWKQRAVKQLPRKASKEGLAKPVSLAPFMPVNLGKGGH